MFQDFFEPSAIVSGTLFGVSMTLGGFYGWVQAGKRADTSLVHSKRALLHDRYDISKIPYDIDVIIIGSGMSGLSCAAVLSRLGKKVLVLEQHTEVCGGGTHMFDVKGYRFDSGLHYTVPWSVPIMALTTGKKPREVCQFDLMGEADGTVDKVYMVNPSEYVTTESANSRPSMQPVEPFAMKYREAHLAQLYNQYPDDHHAIDEFMRVSNNGMLFVKVLLFSRLLPMWLQKIYWRIMPEWVSEGVNTTAKDFLGKLTKNPRLITLLTSMWIDTGARPDRASFMMTSAVFRGIAMEGGSYPAGGSEALARELVPLIESYGGRVLIKAAVKEILVGPADGGKTERAFGVQMTDGTVIRCRESVVSSAGFHNTMNYLLPAQVSQRYDMRTAMPEEVPQSASYIMCNIGIRAKAEDIGVTNTNVLHIPMDGNDCAFGALDAYFKDPVGKHSEPPVFITFPSMKDKEWSKNHPGKVSCQILAIAEYDWFSQFKDTTAPASLPGSHSARHSVEYEQYKKLWSDKCLAIFLHYFPKAREFVEVVDLSTPLSIEDYLAAYRGAGVGLDVTPERFSNTQLRLDLDMETKIRGLYMTGQDTLMLGVTLCQMSGVITALRMTGFSAAVKILAQSIMAGN